ncbi:hypothetical protein KFE25_007506 [Diacronema lutheri]|uniref:JmjC domain-containing protein n=2 Tax=Diacronema lutheri TaxID=2081491 RepID=A0A8J5XPB1_DIALT|nr:hypothetical protein KFE25_007506 [Diacronema lutheri]
MATAIALVALALVDTPLGVVGARVAGRRALARRAALQLDASIESTLGAAKEEAVRSYSELLFRLAADNHPGIFAACERMFHDGVRVRDLPFHVRGMLEGKLPPEISAVAGDDAFIGDAADGAPRLQEYAPPGVWVRPAGGVVEVGPEAVEEGWRLAETLRAPVLFRAVGSDWPAVREWRQMRTLAEQIRYAMVRVAPGPAVAFCRESHPDVRAGLVEPPSRVVAMPFGHFCRRLREGRGGLQPLLGDDRETVYMQALAPDGLMADARVEELLAPRDARARAPRPPITGRLWVCAPGVWSPGHFDAVDSLLWQAVGAKRMILFPPSLTPLLDPHPSGHALERRLRLPLTGERPADESLAARIDAAALLADLRPGDAIFFPAGWAHHTEAVRGEEQLSGVGDGISISLGLRI